MYKREVKLSGHIIDSLILPKALDLIMDMGGDFKILEFEVGKLKGDVSHATNSCGSIQTKYFLEKY